MSDAQHRVVVCGAGAIGTSIAYYLAERGLRPTVFDRGGIACAASGKSGGFLARDWSDGSPLADLAHRSFDLHAKLARRLDADVGYRRLHTLGVAVSDDVEQGTFAGQGAPEWLDGRGLVHTVLGRPETTAQVHPARLVQGLAEAATRLGACFHVGRVEGIELRGEPPIVAGVKVDGELVAADRVIIALGPWSGMAGQWVPMPPVSGQRAHSIVMHPRQPVGAHALFVDFRGADGHHSPEIYPRPDGEVYVCGMSDQCALPEDPLAVTLDESACRRLKEMTDEISSILANTEVETAQACYLPVAYDGLPLIGAVPMVEGAYVATGHTCWGILNAPATGEAMAELIADGHPSSVDLSPFDPQRAFEIGSRLAR